MNLSIRSLNLVLIFIRHVLISNFHVLIVEVLIRLDLIASYVRSLILSNSSICSLYPLSIYSSFSCATRHLKQTYRSSFYEKNTAGALWRSQSILIDWLGSRVAGIAPRPILSLFSSGLKGWRVESFRPSYPSAAWSIWRRISSFGKFASKLKDDYPSPSGSGGSLGDYITEDSGAFITLKLLLGMVVILMGEILAIVITVPFLSALT